MQLIVTIDTEEDNWASYSTIDNPVSSIEKLIPLQQMFDRYQIKPTYMITYPVATNPRSVEILKNFLDQGKCEIGAHCHPWNTPPFEENINEFNSMLCNLPEELILKKLTALHQSICDNFGIIPVSFRSGRWGFSQAVARSLVALGYKIDSSVTPFFSWKEYDGPDFRGFPYLPYRFNPDDIATPDDHGPLLQVPATVGFLQGHFEICRKATIFLENEIIKKTKIKGFLHKINLLNRVWLSPEHADIATMIKLSERVKAQGISVLNMSFHSTTLQAGLSPFMKSQDQEVRFLEKVESFLSYAQTNNFRSATLNSLT